MLYFKPVRLFVFTLLCCTIIACKKKEETVDDGSNALYTFTNHLNKPIVVKVFPDSDYTEQAITRIEIPPGQKGIVPPKMFYLGSGSSRVPMLLKYYWATTDNSISNWSKGSWPTFHYDPAVQRKNIDIYPSEGDDRLGFFLNSIDYKGVWKYIDAFDANGVSIWNTIDPYEKDRTVEIDWVKRLILRAPDFALQYNGIVYSNNHTILCADNNGVYKPEYIQFTNDCRPYTNLYTNMPGRAYLIIDNKPPYYLLAKQ